MIFILIISCEDDLNPFIKGEDVFIVNCILKNDRGVQTVYLSKNYQAENFDPKSNTEDHSIGNGFVRVFFKDSVKIFSDTLVTQNIDGNEKSFNSYINSNFLTKPNTEYELEA
ncbi:MAG: DUF4249 family protein, partial [Ignavibacteriae bacterium]|nr:DUF4249 family protein [Ignavibacteriota bacterium]